MSRPSGNLEGGLAGFLTPEKLGMLRTLRDQTDRCDPLIPASRRERIGLNLVEARSDPKA